MDERRAVILAGGQGSRLRPFTFAIPKPLIPVGDLPIIEILLRQLSHYGFTRVSVAVGYHRELIRSFCGDGSRWGIRVDYLVEDEPLGTAGSLAMLDEPVLDRVLVVNGDTLTDMDLRAVHDGHRSDDAMTVCIARRTVPLPFGSVERDADDRLARYTEKPVLSYDAAMGISIVSTRVLPTVLPEPEHIDMPELVHRFNRAGGTVRVHRSEDRWLDVGHLDELEEATAIVEQNRALFIP
jgi:NDP-sugar pyrophosphorylase family protein